MNDKDNFTVQFKYVNNIAEYLSPETMPYGLRDGCIDLPKYHPLINTNYRENITVSQIKDLYGYEEKYLQAIDDDSGLYFLYEKCADDDISTVAYKAMVLDNEGRKWKIKCSSTNPHVKEAFEHSYTDMERSIYTSLSPEVFGIAGHGRNSTQAFKNMFTYMKCLDVRIVLLRSKYLITEDLFIDIPLTILGSDNLSYAMKAYSETKDTADLTDYPYGIILRDCNIYALSDSISLQYELYDFYNNKEFNKKNDNSHFVGQADLSSGLAIGIFNVLIVNEKELKLHGTNYNKNCFFYYDKRYTTMNNVACLGVDIRPIDATVHKSVYE